MDGTVEMAEVKVPATSVTDMCRASETESVSLYQHGGEGHFAAARESH